MIDTHSHLLPGLDHGCPDLQTSLRMARAAARAGVETIVCTPHLTEWDDGFLKRAGSAIREVRAALAGEGIEVELLLGFEVELSLAVGAGIERLTALTVESSGNSIVLETPFVGWPVFIEETIFRLTTGGITPILAHPERNDQVQKSPELLRRLMAAGAVIQATAASFGGTFGRTPMRVFQRMLSEGLVSLLASDAHSFAPEGWTLAPLLESLADRLSPENVVTLTQTNPRLVLEGKPLNRIEPSGGQTSRLRGKRPKYF